MHKSVVILGWKRNKLPNLLELCKEVSLYLASLNYDIYTGGGDGFMKMGNIGAFEKNKSYGVLVDFLDENENEYINHKIVCNNFSTRKDILMKNKDLVVFFPGGMGTIDEFTELLNWIKTGEIKKTFKIILFGKSFWTQFINFFDNNNILFPIKLIDLITDDINEFKNIIY